MQVIHLCMVSNYFNVVYTILRIYDLVSLAKVILTSISLNLVVISISLFYLFWSNSICVNCFVFFFISQKIELWKTIHRSWRLNCYVCFSDSYAKTKKICWQDEWKFRQENEFSWFIISHHAIPAEFQVGIFIFDHLKSNLLTNQYCGVTTNYL